MLGLKEDRVPTCIGYMSTSVVVVVVCNNNNHNRDNRDNRDNGNETTVYVYVR